MEQRTHAGSAHVCLLSRGPVHRARPIATAVVLLVLVMRHQLGVRRLVANRITATGVTVYGTNLTYRAPRISTTADFKALKDINLKIQEHGRSPHSSARPAAANPHCSKTLNRMNDLVEGCRIDGKILLDGKDIFAPDMDVI